MNIIAKYFIIGSLALAVTFFFFACDRVDKEDYGFDSEQLQVTLMFHLNQDLVPYAWVGDELSYSRLISTLLEFPNVPVQLHISGTLLHTLKWMDSPTLDLIREGVERGQFELLVSTYSQNIIEATSDSLLNAVQFELHKDLVAREFGVETLNFWNAERVWTAGVSETIAGWGEFRIPVESHILIESGLDSLDRRNWVYETRNGPLKIMHDDARFRQEVNHVFNTGELDRIEAYLSKIDQHNQNRDFLVGFYEDAESVGLWQYEGGHVHPDSTMNNLRTLLYFLDESDWIQPTTPDRFFSRIEPEPFPGTIADGEAKWMIEFSETLGHDSWFDYLENNEIKRRILDVFDELKPEVGTISRLVKENPENTAARKLFGHALFHYAAYSYELGASWYWSGDDAGFHRAIDMRFTLFAVEESFQTRDFLKIADINRDGVEELIWRNENQLLIFQADEARILYWFDLDSGSVLLDNSLAYYYDEYFIPGNHRLPEILGGETAYPWLSGHDLIPEIIEEQFNLRATGPDLYLNGNLAEFASSLQTAEGPAWTGTSGNGISVRLRPALNDGVSLVYTIENNGEETQEIDVALKQVFAIDPKEMLDGGPETLHYESGVWTNTKTGTSLGFEIFPEAADRNVKMVLFGKQDIRELELNLEPGESKEISVRFSRLN